jgi:hypothetical protein
MTPPSARPNSGGDGRSAAFGRKANIDEARDTTAGGASRVASSVPEGPRLHRFEPPTRLKQVPARRQTCRFSHATFDYTIIESKILEVAMCRNIKTLFNFEPPATDDEIRASALQFVRKLSGFNKPSKINEVAFDLAVEEIHEAARTLIHSLTTSAPLRDRESLREKGRVEAAKRFGRQYRGV